MIRRIFPPKEAEVKVEVTSGFDAYDLRLGDLMRGERATLGKSLLDVQRDLRIKASYIAAIENTDPSAFESPSFIAGYVRSYSRYLGMDPEWAFQKFCAESDFVNAHGMTAKTTLNSETAAERDVRRKSENRDPLSDPDAAFMPLRESIFAHIEPSAIGSLLVLAALIGGIGYGGLAVLQEVQRVQFTPVQEQGIAASVDPFAINDGTDETASYTPAPTADALDRLYRPKPLDVPVMTARDGPISALNPENFGTFADETSGDELRRVMAGEFATPDPTMIKVREEGVPEVAIFAVRQAWVRVTSSTGAVIYEKIMQPGEKYVLPKTEQAPTLRTGYAGTVYFAVNGQAYGPAGDGATVVSKIALGEEAIRAKYSVADLNANQELAKVVAELSQ